MNDFITASEARKIMVAAEDNHNKNIEVASLNILDEVNKDIIKAAEKMENSLTIRMPKYCYAYIFNFLQSRGYQINLGQDTEEKIELHIYW